MPPLNVTGQDVVDALKAAVSRAGAAQRAMAEAAAKLVPKPPPGPPTPPPEAK